MKGSRYILATLLLGIYSVVVLHNISPHFHCNTDSNNTSTESAHILHAGLHHSHQHDEQSHHEEAESGWIDALLGLLGDLEHHDLGEGHFENFTAQSQNFNFNFSSIELIDGIDCDIIAFSASQTLTLDKCTDFIDRPPIIYEQQHDCSTPLRGPPTIS